MCSFLSNGTSVCDGNAVISCTGAGIGTWTDCGSDQTCSQGICGALDPYEDDINSLCPTVPVGTSVCSGDKNASISCTDINNGTWTNCSTDQTCSQGICAATDPNQGEILNLCSTAPSGTLICSGDKQASVLCAGAGNGTWTDCGAKQSCSQGVCIASDSNQYSILDLCSAVPTGTSVCNGGKKASTVSCTDGGSNTLTDCGANQTCAQGVCVPPSSHLAMILNLCSMVPNGTTVCNKVRNATVTCIDLGTGIWAHCASGSCTQGVCS